MPTSSRLIRGIVIALVIAAAAPVAAQDHEKCYQISDPAKIKGTVDLTTPAFGLEPGCKIGPAKWFCSPASKSAVAVTANKVPVVPLPLYAPPATVDRICYKVKCPIPPPPFPPDENVTDQFGNRTLHKFKASFVCTPAVMGASFCGNGVIDPGEDCDGAALGACAAGCRANCTCQCETACCYVESFATAPDTECFQYSGNPAQVAAFQTSCTNGVAPPATGVPASFPVISMGNSNVGPPSFVAGPCSTGPIYGMPCLPGPPSAGNLHVVPSDSTCP